MQSNVAARLSEHDRRPRNGNVGRILLVLAGTVLLAGSVTAAATVTLPAGSADGLGPAIAAAGPEGTVLVQAGIHTESASVAIQTTVSLVGEPGAILESTTTPLTGPPYVIDAALHIQNAAGVSIQGLELRPLAGSAGNTAILVENSPDAAVTSNTITGYGAGVIVQNGQRADISGNDISIPSGGLHGITIVNGEFARVESNTISNAVFGIWACDAKGRAAENVVRNSQIGIILCKVPQALIVSGSLVGSEHPANSWHVHENDVEGNFFGYAITDGSHDNILANNSASGNFIDVELLGDSTFFGFFTPSVFDNVIALGDNSAMSVHDCGANTVVSGNANVIDLSVVPCF